VRSLQENARSPITTVEVFSAIRNCAACARRRQFVGHNLQRRGDYAAGASFFDKSASLIYVRHAIHDLS